MSIDEIKKLIKSEIKENIRLSLDIDYTYYGDYLDVSISWEDEILAKESIPVSKLKDD